MDTFLYSRTKHFQNQDFPLVVSYHKQTGVEPHIHDFYELVIVRNGSGLHMTENLDFPISVGDVFVLKPQNRHYYSEANKLELINILYCPEKLGIPQSDIRDIPGYYVLFEAEPILKEKGKFKSRLTLEPDQLTSVEKIVSKLYAELTEQKKGYCFTALSYFMELISYLSRCYTVRDNKYSQKLLKVSSMMNFIEHNFRDKILLDDIIREANMSLSTANRAFREALNMTPVDYLIKIRIEYAASLLRLKDTSIIEAATDSGFCDSNYFAKRFRKFMGMSPRAYKKMFGVKI